MICRYTPFHSSTVFNTLPLAFNIAVAGMLSVSSTNANAAVSPALDRFNLSVGAYYVDPNFRVNANTRYGTFRSGEIERDRTALPRVRAEILILENQGLAFDYFTFRKNYGGTVSRPLPGGASLNGSGDANIQVDFASLAYKWWFGQGNDVFGIGVGAGYYRVHLDVNAMATLNGVSGRITNSQTEKTVAPLLALGWKHALSNNVRLYAEGTGVKKNWGQVTGEVYGAAAGAEWYPLANLGVGADYGLTRIKLDRGGPNNASLDIRLKGPSAYLKVRF